MKHTKNIIQPLDQTSTVPSTVNTVIAKENKRQTTDLPTDRLLAREIHSRASIEDPMATDDDTLSIMPASVWLRIAILLPIPYITADYFIRLITSNPAFADPFIVFPLFLLLLVWFGGVILLYKRCSGYLDQYRVTTNLFLLAYFAYFLPLSQGVGRLLLRGDVTTVTELVFIVILLLLSVLLIYGLVHMTRRVISKANVITLFAVPAIATAIMYGFIYIFESK